MARKRSGVQFSLAPREPFGFLRLLPSGKTRRLSAGTLRVPSHVDTSGRQPRNAVLVAPRASLPCACLAAKRVASVLGPFGVICLRVGPAGLSCSGKATGKNSTLAGEREHCGFLSCRLRCAPLGSLLLGCDSEIGPGSRGTWYLLSPLEPWSVSVEAF